MFRKNAYGESRVRSRLRVGVVVRVKVGFKYSVGVLHRLGGCYVGKGDEKIFFGRLWRHHMYGR